MANIIGSSIRQSDGKYSHVTLHAVNQGSLSTFTKPLRKHDKELYSTHFRFLVAVWNIH